MKFGRISTVLLRVREPPAMTAVRSILAIAQLFLGAGTVRSHTFRLSASTPVRCDILVRLGAVSLTFGCDPHSVARYWRGVFGVGEPGGGYGRHGHAHSRPRATRPDRGPRLQRGARG